MAQESNVGPLKGMRILDIATMIASPFATALLAEFGAEVIKVELPGKGDGLRQFPPFYEGISLHFAVTSRNKKSITLDLRQPTGQEIFKRLVAVSDAVAENFVPGTLEGWGLGYDELRKVNPRLVMVRISGYGQTGPYRHKHGFGTTCQALSGLTYITGYPDRPPLNPPFSLADYIAGLFAAWGTMMALYHRDARGGGQGQEIDVGLYEGVFRLLEFLAPEYDKLGLVRERVPVPQGAAPIGTYPTQDQKWVVITVSTDPVFVRLARAMGQEALAQDPRFVTNARRVENRDAVNALVGRWAASCPLAEIMQRCDQWGVPASPVHSIADIFRDPQFQARANILEVADPALGRVKMPGVVPKLSLTPGAVAWGAPRLGQHNEEIYGQLLGLSPEEVKALQAQGVI